MEFQAETRQLLDIVTHSLYTDKEVFLRELVSNASDALEKLRHLRSAGDVGGGGNGDGGDGDGNVGGGGGVPLEIRIETDEASNTLTITDTGVGMTRAEMVSNLGTIARSGSKAFVEEMKMKEAARDTGDYDPYGQGIIGKFGVGFYSGFMVADKVDVRSRSATATAAAVGGGGGDDRPGGAVLWESTGTGRYTLAPLPPDVRQDRGTSVVLHLKSDLSQYSDESTVESILKKYSNFVGFPIYLNGNRVNTIEAIWLQDPKTVDESKHSDFYKYVSHMYDEPLSTLHFRMDAPLDIKALLYVPSFHQEKYGMGRMDPGVSLYSRKILVEPKSPDILPEWCRFIKGVVDSEDLPLSISREKTQDSALVGKMRKALTRKVISHLSTMMRSVSRFFSFRVCSTGCASFLVFIFRQIDTSAVISPSLMLFLYFTDDTHSLRRTSERPEKTPKSTNLNSTRSTPTSSRRACVKISSPSNLSRNSYTSKRRGGWRGSSYPSTNMSRAVLRKPRIYTTYARRRGSSLYRVRTWRDSRRASAR
jgi:HSP90 family molecular chaperone